MGRLVTASLVLPSCSPPAACNTGAEFRRRHRRDRHQSERSPASGRARSPIGSAATYFIRSADPKGEMVLDLVVF
jgi:hypothetical protein